MNKRILGVRIGTVVTAVLCLAVALVFWMLVKYVSASESLMLVSSLKAYIEDFYEFRVLLIHS